MNKNGQIGKLRCINSSKRGQIGETMTWIVATIIIILVLGASIFLSAIYINQNKKIQSLSSQTKDVLASKSLYSYMLTGDASGKRVYSQIKEEGDLNEFNGNLGIKIFSNFGDDYDAVWLGVADERDFFPAVSNDYFLTRRGIGEIPYSHSDPNIMIDEISLDENKTVALALIKKR